MSTKQIDSIVGIDRMDTIDRAKLDPSVKLVLICDEARAEYGADPRGGGFAFVGRPRVILQVFKDLKVGPLSSIIRLQRVMVIGTVDSDVAGWWCDIPIIVRCSVTDDSLHALPINRIPQSKQVDRKRAGQIRMAAHNDHLEALE